MPTTVKQCMTSHDFTISSNESIQHAARLMKQHDIGFLPVIDGERIQGVITDRDIVIRAVAEQKNLDDDVQKICTEQIVHIEPEATLEEAASKMAQHQVRRLVVSHNGKLLGVLALADLARTEAGDLAAGQALSGISQR